MSVPSAVGQVRESRSARCDTRELFGRWRRERDVRAREALVHEYLPLARKLASRWGDTPEPFEDLMQVATIGLLGAIDRFDPDRGVTFGSYATPTILGELRRHFRDHCWKVHVTRSDQELVLAMQHARRELTTELRRAPTVEQLAGYLGISVERALTGLDATSARELASLDAPISDGAAESETLGEMLGCEDDRYALVDARLSLSRAVGQLSGPERELLELSLSHQLTQRQIGARLGVSQMHVSRLLRRTLGKLSAAYHDVPAPESQTATRSTPLRVPAMITDRAGCRGWRARASDPVSRPGSDSRAPLCRLAMRIASLRGARLGPTCLGGPTTRMHLRDVRHVTRRDSRLRRRSCGRAPPLDETAEVSAPEMPADRAAAWSWLRPGALARLVSIPATIAANTAFDRGCRETALAGVETVCIRK